MPEWAKKLVRKHELRPRHITLVIRYSRTKPYTSGHCAYWSDRIVVTLGAGDEREHRYVVLHEIAHTRAGPGHEEDFYDRLYAMVKAEGLYRYCINGGSRHFGTQGLRAAARRARQAAA